MATNPHDKYDTYTVAEIEKFLENAALDELFYLKELRQRKLFLLEDIDPLSVSPIVRHILQMNKEDKANNVPVEERDPIFLYISSNGGEVDSGFELIDVILSSKTPVYTINLGYQYSMGFLIGLAGHKRFAMRNSKFLMHDGAIFIYNSGSKAKDQMLFQEKVEKRVRDFILERSKLTPKEYDKNLKVEWYMFADEAKEKGFVDYIIGEDCDIESVI